MRILYAGNQTLSLNEIRQMQVFLPGGEMMPIQSLNEHSTQCWRCRNTAAGYAEYGRGMIVGIIAENAIFTFLQFQESFKETNDRDKAVTYSISTRLRPKLMTALGAIIALMPIALGIGTGAQLHPPLAIAVIGGFIIALPLLLIVLPTLIHLLYKNKRAEGETIEAVG